MWWVLAVYLVVAVALAYEVRSRHRTPSSWWRYSLAGLMWPLLVVAQLADSLER